VLIHIDSRTVVRDVAGDLVEDVTIIDRFTHPKTQRDSLTARVVYRSFDRSLVNEEVNMLQDRVVSRLEELGVEIR